MVRAKNRAWRVMEGLPVTEVETTDRHDFIVSLN